MILSPVSPAVWPSRIIVATVGNEIDSLEGAEPRFLRFSSHLAPFAAPHDAHRLCGRWRTLLSATGHRTKPLYRDFPASQVASSNFIFSFLNLDAPIKMQHHREQTAHLQTALLHRLRCGPRYEPLSRTPFARRLYPEGLNMRFTEFACCRSDLCNASS